MRVSLLLVAALCVACGTTAPQSPAPSGDAGVSHDAGPALDAGATTDAGVQPNEPDAGDAEDAGFTQDAGLTPDAGAEAALIAQRPYDVVVPPTYDGATPMPLVILLHGFSADATTQDLYLGLSSAANRRGFLLAKPNGTPNAALLRFWNATDACCAFGADVDDVAYLTAVMNDMQRRFAVDPKRVYFVGHSNGGFMSHRMACDRSGRVAAIASLAGAVWNDASRCNPTEPVSVLEAHGTADTVIWYTGGLNGTAWYPGAEETVATWADKNGCSGAKARLRPDADYVYDLLGAETERYAYGGCPSGGAVELWKMVGATHLPTFNPAWVDAVYDWLLAHPKP